MVLENVINTKHYFQCKKKKKNITNSSHKIQNSKHYFQRKYGIQNPKHYFEPKEIAANFSYKIQNHRRYLNVSRNIIT